jgi:steroid 5-alpha reductase family enzyme
MDRQPDEEERQHRGHLLGAGFVITGWLYFALTDGFVWRKVLLMAMVTVWGLRLSGYILWRNWGKGEDFRYRKWRDATAPAHITSLDDLGLFLWVIGFYFEAVGDLQLARFKADPANRGKVMDQGVWRYTRHPNYFGDSAQWWGYYLVALAAGGWWTVFSPILMTLLLLRVSGVALLEKTLVETKPQYREYVERTSAFLPLPPRRKKTD